MTCKHLPHRLYAWFARNDQAKNGQTLVVICRDCKKVLKGGAKL